TTGRAGRSAQRAGRYHLSIAVFRAARSLYCATELSHRRHAHGRSRFASSRPLANRHDRTQHGVGAVAIVDLAGTRSVRPANDRANRDRFATNFRASRAAITVRLWSGTPGL